MVPRRPTACLAPAAVESPVAIQTAIARRCCSPGPAALMVADVLLRQAMEGLRGGMVQGRSVEQRVPRALEARLRTQRLSHISGELVAWSGACQHVAPKFEGNGIAMTGRHASNVAPRRRRARVGVSVDMVMSSCHRTACRAGLRPDDCGGANRSGQSGTRTGSTVTAAAGHDQHVVLICQRSGPRPSRSAPAAHATAVGPGRGCLTPCPSRLVRRRRRERLPASAHARTSSPAPRSTRRFRRRGSTAPGSPRAPRAR
jgi:hypothetical protein